MTVHPQLLCSFCWFLPLMTLLPKIGHNHPVCEESLMKRTLDRALHFCMAIMNESYLWCKGVFCRVSCSYSLLDCWYVCWLRDVVDAYSYQLTLNNAILAEEKHYPMYVHHYCVGLALPSSLWSRTACTFWFLLHPGIVNTNCGEPECAL